MNWRAGYEWLGTTRQALVMASLSFGNAASSQAEGCSLTLVLALDVSGPVSAADDAVLHGPGAFTVLADGYEDHERAMMAKLLRDLELPVVGGWAAGEGAG